MMQQSEEGRSFRCLVCAARVGQFVPFCEWCGAKHSFAGGELVLTGAICQECGFQAAVAFSRCPQCRAERRILCPACGVALAVRQTCNNCGLHFLFFDKVRREHSRLLHRSGTARMHAGRRKLMFVAFMLAVSAPLVLNHEAQWLSLTAILAMLGTIALASAAIKLNEFRLKKRAAHDLVAVLESYDPAEAMAARAWLRLSGIEAFAISGGANAASSPPNGLRRIMVPRRTAAQAAGCLAKHGFEIVAALRTNGNSLSRSPLRLVHSARLHTEGRGSRKHD